jgi:hypothetical protein
LDLTARHTKSEQEIAAGANQFLSIPCLLRPPAHLQVGNRPPGGADGVPRCVAAAILAASERGFQPPVHRRNRLSAQKLSTTGTLV